MSLAIDSISVRAVHWRLWVTLICVLVSQGDTRISRERTVCAEETEEPDETPQVGPTSGVPVWLCVGHHRITPALQTSAHSSLSICCGQKQSTPFDFYFYFFKFPPYIVIKSINIPVSYYVINVWIPPTQHCCDSCLIAERWRWENDASRTLTPYQTSLGAIIVFAFHVHVLCYWMREVSVTRKFMDSNGK